MELGRDLLLQDLETLLREPRFRAGLVETPKKGTYFVLFNCRASPPGGECRRSAARSPGSTRSQDFVWGALGRFALPATGVIPPGILGHDPGRRRPHLPRERALAMLESAGVTLPVRLKASVHPILQDRFRALTSALFGIWRDLGVEVDVVTSTMAGVPGLAEARRGGRPDRALDGRLRRPGRLHVQPLQLRERPLPGLFSSPEVDRLLTEARAEIRAARSRGALPQVRAAPPRRGRRHPALSRGRLPDRRPGSEGRDALEQPSVRELRRDRRRRRPKRRRGGSAGGVHHRADRGRRSEHRSGASVADDGAGGRSSRTSSRRSRATSRARASCRGSRRRSRPRTASRGSGSA